MKKILTVFSSLIGIFLISSAYSNPYYQSRPQPYYQPSPQPCVGYCEEQYTRPCRSGNFYVGAFGGANWLNVDGHHGEDFKLKTGYTGSLSLGYKLNNLRFEGEAAYRHNTIKHNPYHISGHASSYSFMANALYDFDEVACYVPNVVPYVGVGLGYTHVRAHVEGNDFHVKGSGNGIAAQAIAGVGYRLTDTTTLGTEYRYFVGKENARDHSVGLALRQAF